MYVSMYGPVHVSTGALESQEMMLEPLELDLHEVVSCPTRVLEAELGPLQEQKVLVTTRPSLPSFTQGWLSKDH